MENGNPLVSVIMSTYNESECELSASIDSILSQSYKNIEFLIVNDNPKNETLRSVLNKYLLQDDRIIILENLENNEVLLIESNYDESMLRAGKYPFFLKERILGNFGHLSNNTSAKLIEYLSKQGTKNFILGHLSEENNFPELARENVISRLKQTGIYNQELSIEIAGLR